MLMFDKPHEIEMVRILALRSAVRLETLGITRNGRSATTIVKELLKLKKNTTKLATLKALEDHIENDLGFELAKRYTTKEK